MTTKKTAASKAASAKTAAKTPVKRVAKKVAAPIATTPVATTPVAATPVAATPVPPAAPAVAPAPALARGEFETLVRAEAHALAQARGYRDGSPFGDWVRAEAGVRARFAAEGRAVAR